MAIKSTGMRTSDLEYIAKFCEYDGFVKTAYALGVSAAIVRETFKSLQESGQLETFRRLNKSYVEVR